MIDAIEDPSIVATVFPMGMSGKKLRKKKCLSERVISAKSFKVCAKFVAVKQRDRLAFLRKMVGKVVKARSFAEMNKQRQGFNQHKIKSLPISENRQCYCCIKNKAVLRHHVITLLNGGRNKRNNIVPLCNDCHCKIHPHMNRRKSANEAVASWHCIIPQNNGPVVVNPRNDKGSVITESA